MEKENITLRSFLINLGVSKIFVDNEKSVEEIIKIITEDKNEKDLLLEIKKLKKIIEENNVEKKKFGKTEKININKSIAIAGGYGCGKSVITALFGKSAKELKIKAIIIDFDIINNSINTLFRIHKYNKSLNGFEQCITKVNSNLDIFYGLDSFFNENNKISFEKVEKLLKELKLKYDLILIDTSSETTLKYVKTIFVNVDKIIFLMEPSMIEIKKAQRLLETYIKDWDIPIYKFKILLNKCNTNSVDEEIIEEMFSKIKIIGKINLSNKYTSLSNNINKNEIILNKYIKFLRKL